MTQENNCLIQGVVRFPRVFHRLPLSANRRRHTDSALQAFVTRFLHPITLVGT
jgi:hypothetical protein